MIDEETPKAVPRITVPRITVPRITVPRITDGV
jgi:hypothetical protein